MVKVGSPKNDQGKSNHFAKALVTGHHVKPQADLDPDGGVYNKHRYRFLTMWIYTF